MAAYFVSEGMHRMKKRKEVEQLEQVNDDFSDFSLSSPARKIRRLDAQLAPIMEEDELEFEPAQNHMNCNGPVIEELENQERAIVPFNPVNNPLFHYHSNVSISLDPALVSGFKDQFLRSSYYGLTNEGEQDKKNQCKAVVPWVPSQLPSMEVLQSEVAAGGELMEDDEMGTATMEIEESSSSNTSVAPGASNGFGGGVWASSSNEGFPQWQQQHCMMPQPPPQNISTPITWLQ